MNGSAQARLVALALAAAAALPARAADPGVQEIPLAARSGPRGATMFTPLSPEATGIRTENQYADPEMWGKHYQELAYGAMGTGLAVGDFDNDGRPDLFTVSKTGQCRLFRNLGNWKFEDVTHRAGLAGSGFSSGVTWLKGVLGSGDASDLSAWRQGATFVDVNNDGWLDLYVCRFNAPNLLYINQRDGTFKEEAAARGLAVTDACGMAAFCDYDRDGSMDVYIQTSMLHAGSHPGGQRDYLFHNRGDGTFENVSDRAGISGESMGHSATWWDYDGDGWPDLYVANDYAAPDRFYRNNRDGTFTDVAATLLPHTPYYAMGSDFGDVNNDGLMDLLVADMAASTRTKDLRGMAGSRARAQLVPDAGAEPPQLMHNALYVNTGAGQFQEAAYLAGFPATDWTWSVRWEDFDNDGRVDLFVTNGMNREYHNADLLGKIMGIENQVESRRAMQALPAFAERHFAFRNLGDLRFEEVGRAWGLDQVGVSFGTVTADFDGDGDLDLAYANYEAGVTVLRNDSAEGHRAVFALKGTQSNRFGIGATIRLETPSGVQVRQLTLARGYLSNSEPVAHFGLGADTRINRAVIDWPGGQHQVLTDLPVDRRFTVTEPAGTARPAPPPPAAPTAFTEVSAARGLGVTVPETFDNETQPLVPTRFDRSGPALAVADLDGDGRDDVVLGGSGRQPAQVLRGGERFQPAGTLPAGPLDDGAILAFDANGDGLADLVVTKAGASRPAGSADYQPQLLLNDGHGGFTPAPGALPPLSISAGAAAAADFDRDGQLDLFIGGRVLPGQYPLAPRSALLANRGGRFEDVTAALAPDLANVGLVRSALWSDLDQDGWPDLVVALEWGGVKYFHNDAGHGFTDWSERAGFAAAGTGWWTSLASADFNGDGRPDLVAGNTGLNTPYQASPERPALLYYGRFGSGPANQLIEASVEDGRLRPRRARVELVPLLPVVGKKFPKNDVFAEASLEEIVGADRLAAARTFSATELRSGVFLSQPDGTWRFEPLPRIAQIAPAQGMVTGDFDGDGRTDLYVVQNSFAPMPAIGRFDGGVSQLFRGDGRGHFDPVPPRQSGLVVPGDAKALALADLDGDGWPTFLVTRNNAPLLAWRHGAALGRHSCHVRLAGAAPGNPTAIGARVSFILADGTRQSAEVQAGGGYLSQSTAGLFFGWPDGNPPARLEVRWPDGTEATRDLRGTAPGPQLTVKQ